MYTIIYIYTYLCAYAYEHSPSQVFWVTCGPIYPQISTWIYPLPARVQLRPRRSLLPRKLFGSVVGAPGSIGWMNTEESAETQVSNSVDLWIRPSQRHFVLDRWIRSWYLWSPSFSYFSLEAEGEPYLSSLPSRSGDLDDAAPVPAVDVTPSEPISLHSK